MLNDEGPDPLEDPLPPTYPNKFRRKIEMKSTLRSFFSVTRVQWIVIALALLVLGMVIGLPTKSEAIPAFARQLNVKCQTCHFPNPPRLNNVGLVFRRMGFRLPDSDDDGNLVFKTPELTSALAFGSAIADLEVEVDKEAPSETESRANLMLGEVALFSAHALPSNLSYWLLFIPRNDEGGTELEFGEMQYNMGKATDAFHVRGGEFLTLWWQKGTDEKITLNAPLILDEASPGSIGSFAGLGLGAKQSGAEFGYTHNRLVDGRLTSTILSATVLNGVNPEGESALRRSGDGFDFLVQGYQLFGSANNVGGFYYHGNTKFADEDGEYAYKDTFDKYGLVGNYYIGGRFGALGGLVGGKDKSTELEQTINNRGWFLEADVSATPKWSFSYRHDGLDPDTDLDGDYVKADTLSTRFHPVDNVLMTLEYHNVRIEEETDWIVAGEVKLAY